MIWEPFVLALFLGLVVSAGLYFAYLWPSVEPEIEPALAGVDSRGKPDVVAPSVPELPAATTAAELVVTPPKSAAAEPVVTPPTPAAAEPVVAPPKLPDPLPEKKAGPPTRPSDGDLTPLPPPQPEDDGLGNDGKASS